MKKLEMTLLFSVLVVFASALIFASYGDLAPSYTQPGVNVSMLWFNCPIPN